MADEIFSDATESFMILLNQTEPTNHKLILFI